MTMYTYIFLRLKLFILFLNSSQCLHETKTDNEQPMEEIIEVSEMEEYVEKSDLRVNMIPKKAQSTHLKLIGNVKINKMTKSAHLLGDNQRSERARDNVEMVIN